MTSFSISVIVFGVIFGGALLGMLLRAALPDHHISTESKDVVKLGTGLVGTMTALVLGLPISSAKGSFDIQNAALTQASANVVLLDRVLAHYGPETKEAREILRGAVSRLLEEKWSGGLHRTSQFGATSTGGEILYFWLTIIFISWGLFAPRNTTVIATFLTVALSVSSAIFLILEMYSPYSGLVQVSSAPLRAALARLGQ